MNPAQPLVRLPGRGIIAGVCAGIAAFLGWDVTVVRVLYVLASILSAGFPGTLVYLALWLVMPVREEW